MDNTPTTAITPQIAADILNDGKLIEKMIAAGTDSEVKKLLSEKGLTENQINGLMATTTPLDTSALDTISGGGKIELPHEITEAIAYVKQNPFKAGCKAFKAVSVVAVPVLLGYHAKQTHDYNKIMLDQMNKAEKMEAEEKEENEG